MAGTADTFGSLDATGADAAKTDDAQDLAAELGHVPCALGALPHVVGPLGVGEPQGVEVSHA